MGLAKGLPPYVKSHFKGLSSTQFLDKVRFSNSMSQNYQQGIFSFSNGFERSQKERQIRPDNVTNRPILHTKRAMRVQGFDDDPALLGFQEEESSGLPVYETAGMLSEMFNFSSATELLENQISQNYQNPRQRVPVSWYQNRQDSIVSGSRDSRNHNVGNEEHHISNTNVDSASAMQLFLMNPQQRSPSPSSSSHHHPLPPSAAVTLHPLSTLEAFHQPVGVTTTAGEAFAAAYETNPIQMPGALEGQGLSLSLSSSLQAAKGEHLRVGEGRMLLFGQGAGGGSTSVQHSFKNFGGGGALQLHGGISQNHQLHGASGSPIAAVNLLRNSVYAKAAQELLEEFCSVDRAQFKKNKFSKNTNPSGGGNSSSSLKDQQPLSAADKHEHQRRKVKLLSMLDEVDRRYNHYCEQMQMVVNSFDMVMGFGSAAPYTSLAQRAMSRHFRCLKDAITAQLKHSCELLGEKNASTLGVTKGETPRLRILEQSLRQQRAFRQMGMLEQDSWRPQRGLPEKSINILRAWLFEHFLHPYPSDADKHLLARQTGLSRNQVSNWFINARVRLWKPMVEEMYQQEAKEETQRDQTTSPTAASTTTEAAATTSAPPTFTPSSKRSEIYVPENDPSLIANRQCKSRNQAEHTNTSFSTTTPATASTFHESDTCHRGRIGGLSDYGTSNTHSGNADIDSTLIRLGTAAAGDVSLTLGLRHAGNVPENNHFSLDDFGGC